MNAVSQAFSRTQGRFQRLFDTISEEYWRTHKTFSRHGCSLLPAGISQRATKVATVLVAVVMLLTLPPIIYSRGFSQPSLYTGIGTLLLFSWLMFYVVVWVAHILWATSYMIGSKFGGSRYFWGIIEKRWSAKIDKITEEFMQQNRQVFLESIQEAAEAEEDDARNANDSN